MKKLILLSVLLISFYSCSKDEETCNAEVQKATQQYYIALSYTNGNPEAVTKIKNEYNAKMNKIYSECK